MNTQKEPFMKLLTRLIVAALSLGTSGAAGINDVEALYRTVLVSCI
jgi:hypothetical protein